MRQITEYYSKIIINSKILETYENDVKEFLIEARLGTSLAPGNIPFTSLTVPVEKYKQFQFKGTKDVVIDHLTVGQYYWFRIKLVKNDGEVSIFQDWVSEQAGDVANNVSFTNPGTIVEKSTAVTFRVTIDATTPLPEDFDHFEWKYSTDTVSNLFTPNVSAKPADPAIDAVPDFTTTAIDDISISFNEDRYTWWHVWARILDKSGNIGTDGWFYVGVGRVLPVSATADNDPYPPDLTDIETPAFAITSNPLNFV